MKMTTTNLSKAAKDFISAEIAKVKTGTSVTNSTFNGVHFDAKAVEAVSLIAEGLIENAKGLRSLAEVLKASNVNIETLLKVGN
jgi:urease gamma subunit